MMNNGSSQNGDNNNKLEATFAPVLLAKKNNNMRLVITIMTAAVCIYLSMEFMTVRTYASDNTLATSQGAGGKNSSHALLVKQIHQLEVRLESVESGMRKATSEIAKAQSLRKVEEKPGPGSIQSEDLNLQVQQLEKRLQATENGIKQATDMTNVHSTRLHKVEDDIIMGKKLREQQKFAAASQVAQKQQSSSTNDVSELQARLTATESAATEAAKELKQLIEQQSSEIAALKNQLASSATAATTDDDHSLRRQPRVSTTEDSTIEKVKDVAARLSLGAVQESLSTSGLAEQSDAFSLLNDKSLEAELNPSVKHLWLADPDHREKPPAMLLMTTAGWMQSDPAKGLDFSRGKRETRLFASLVNHPWFHPTAWQDIEEGRLAVDPNVRYYVFPDWSTCPDANFPVYGGMQENLDARFNRTHQRRKGSVDPFKLIKKGRLFRESNRATFVVFDAHGDGPLSHEYEKRNDGALPLSFVSHSAYIRRSHESLDMGLVPPAGKEVNLTVQEIEDIESCAAESEEKRPILLSYFGNFRSRGGDAYGARAGLANFNDNKTVFVLRYFKDEVKRSAVSHLSYEEVLRQSRFSAAPRGDNKFSYRFTELLSAGAIPVVMADDWLWPFRPELVDWNECAINLPENGWNRTMEVINSLTTEQRCKMRQKCYEIYRQYIAFDRGVVKGIVDGLEHVAKGEERKEFFGVRCVEGRDDPKTECNFQRRRRHRRRLRDERM